MTNEYKNQHWLPQVYLRGFLPDGEYKIAVCRLGADKDYEKYKQLGLKKVACSSYFYGIEQSDGSFDNSAEHRFHIMETKFGEIIKKLEVPGDKRLAFLLSETDIGNLAMFVSELVARTEPERTRVFHQYDGVAVNLKKELINSGQNKKYPEVIEDTDKILSGSHDCDKKKELSIQTTELLAPAYERDIFNIKNHDWKFVYSPTDCNFITCDDPMAIQIPNGNKDQILAWVPLSKNVGLALFQKADNRMNRITFGASCGKKSTRDINSLMVLTAYRRVFGPQLKQLRYLEKRTVNGGSRDKPIPRITIDVENTVEKIIKHLQTTDQQVSRQTYYFRRFSIIFTTVFSTIIRFFRNLLTYRS